jgi:maltooligosyltrehalose trehalohydrolase
VPLAEPLAPVRPHRRRSIGVEPLSAGTAHARVWAPACRRVEVLLHRADGAPRVALHAESDGFFSGDLPEARTGDRYQFVLDGDRIRPDPASRFQPDGPHGPSEIVDPAAFRWTDSSWRGIGAVGQVLYEMHIGTFTGEGTWEAAARELPELARLGITVIEMMPVAEFSGRFGWGYDGVDLYAPTRLYGRPDDLRAFVNRAHELGVGVILDVVYNHLGPDGNYLADFSPDYFTDKYTNDWGKALNFEGPAPAREFFVENAAYWIDEFHFDGLRLDATQDINDASPTHVMGEMVARAREAAGDRCLYIIAENEPQETRLVRAAASGGYGADALWNDDYHHTAFVALTGRREAYFLDYTGSPQEFLSSVKYGYLFQGQWYAWQQQRRGSYALDLPGHAFVSFLENHDQVANTAFGRRLHEWTSPGKYRALTALTLLGPATPMLFQGQEFASSARFLYFCDHRGELRDPIRAGRREFLTQFASTLDSDVQSALPIPDDEKTFQVCKLDFGERITHAEMYALHRDLLRLRRSDPAIAASPSRRPDGAVLAAEAFVIRFQGGGHDDRLLIVNLGADLRLTPVPEPLLAPPDGQRWALRWSSEAVAYGGMGRAPLKPHPEWHVPGEAAILLAPEPDVDAAKPFETVGNEEQ